jgi:VWFA-related protein
MRSIASLLLLASLLCTAQTSDPVFRSGSNEVLLDLIIRDKKGALVRDLQPGDLEVVEDGVKQSVRYMRYLDGAQPFEAAAEAGGTVKPVDPEKQIRLVSLVFERFASDARVLARQAMADYLKNGVEQNTFYAVFVLDQRLILQQNFTRDMAKIREAIEKATGGAETNRFGVGVGAQNEIGARTVAEVTSPNQVDSGSFAAAAMQRVVASMQDYVDSTASAQQGANQIDSLRGMIAAQRVLPGRKTAVFFSTGITRSQANDQLYRTLLSEANRANFTFYTIDARGLLTNSQMDGTRSGLQRSTWGAGTGLRNDGAGLAGIGASDAAIDSTMKNTQENLNDLAKSTGGFMISDTNDFRAPMARIRDEVRSYYELTYATQNTNWDGRFRAITVKALRPGLVVQARNGYFALPPELLMSLGGRLNTWEMPLLKAVGTQPLPRELDYRATAIPFQRDGEETAVSVAFEVPTSQLLLVEDKQAKQARVYATFLALVKDSNGAVVKKLSREVPFGVPLDKAPLLKEAPMIYSEVVKLPAGRYTLETSAMDMESKKVSAKRAVLNVSVTTDLRASAPVLVRRIDPKASNNAQDPWQFDGGRVTPNLFQSVKSGKDAELSLYFVVYPTANEAAKPELTLQLVQEDKLLAQAPLELPAADAQGRIPFIATLPAAALSPGMYEVRLLLKQAERRATQRAIVTVE